MVWLVGLMSLSIVAVVALGIYFEARPLQQGSVVPQWLKGAVAFNILAFLGAQAGLVLLGLNDAAAQTLVVTERGPISIGFGLALIGAGLPTAIGTLAAAMAVGPVGSAALAVLAEKPEVFGRSLVYMGLAEGIAIYGLVISILLLGAINP
jgi:V/A-type H+-transporting ATPase subunit K